MLIGMRHTKVQANLVQEIRFWQCHPHASEITLDIKNQTISPFLETFVVIEGTIRAASIMIQSEGFHQSGVIFVRREKGNPHASGWAAMHSV